MRGCMGTCLTRGLALIACLSPLPSSPPASLAMVPSLESTLIHQPSRTTLDSHLMEGLDQGSRFEVRLLPRELAELAPNHFFKDARNQEDHRLYQQAYYCEDRSFSLCSLRQG